MRIEHVAYSSFIGPRKLAVSGCASHVGLGSCWWWFGLVAMAMRFLGLGWVEVGVGERKSVGTESVAELFKKEKTGERVGDGVK